MFQYLYDGEYHSNTTNTYLKALGMDSEQIESVKNQEQFELEQEKDKVRQLRDVKLAAVLAQLDRYSTQLVTPGVTPTDSEQVYLSLLTLAQLLRDVPQQSGFPYSVVWPE